MDRRRLRLPRALNTRHLRAEDARRLPWKNGRGLTSELALWPPGASFERLDFDWRLSRAAVDEPAPFSHFPGFERVLVITAGAGLRLAHGDAPPVELRRLQPHRFPGDVTTTAALLEGPVADFNLLARRGAVEARVDVLRLGHEAVDVPFAAGPGSHGVLHLVTGRAEARLAGTLTVLAPGESLWLVEPPTPGRIALTGTGELLAVQLEARGPPRG